jgi:hypothetical protein
MLPDWTITALETSVFGKTWPKADQQQADPQFREQTVQLGYIAALYQQ